ncbi:MAG TPA: hypothetical protein VHX17_13540 [Candidatus Cybelea sp.]|jgi:DNA mismatch repair ATPase MutS|nr:hypothetical protein [Candidatus Cybelea sp.]
MFRDRDFDPEAPGMPRGDTLVDDLELATLRAAMSREDALLSKVVASALLQPLVEVDEILYRQAALRDCFQNAQVIREIYDLANNVCETERRRFYRSSRSPSSVMFWSVSLLEALTKGLRRLRSIAASHEGSFRSDAFRTIFSTLRAELSDEYLAAVDRHLRQLSFQDGVLLSASLGEGNRGKDYILSEPPRDVRGWFARLFKLSTSGPHTLRISDRDEAGARALANLRDRGLNLVANAVAQSCDHLLSFYDLLRTELAFYVGCINLRARLRELNLPTCFPEPTSCERLDWRADRFYDICLALRIGGSVVPNNLDANGKALVVITGANQGGKSTYLRAISVSYLMMQSGMFVAASSLRASICRSIFTHYRREEDADMRSGKLDSELHQMSDIADALSSYSVVFFNESFACTNEREGSEIARQIVDALLENKIRIFFVTHQFEFTRAYERLESTLFLRAERLPDGTRTFTITPAEPLATSYGCDLYRETFGTPAAGDALP